MPSESNIKRINMTIDAELHEQAQVHAKTIHRTTFSGLVTKLLLEDMKRPLTPRPDPLPSLAEFLRAKADLEKANPNETPRNQRSRSKP